MPGVAIHALAVGCCRAPFYTLNAAVSLLLRCAALTMALFCGRKWHTRCVYSARSSPQLLICHAAADTCLLVADRQACWLAGISRPYRHTTTLRAMLPAFCCKMKNRTCTSEAVRIPRCQQWGPPSGRASPVLAALAHPCLVQVGEG